MPERREELVAESPETELGTPGCVWADENFE
jgi:hypothetical protein